MRVKILVAGSPRFAKLGARGGWVLECYASNMSPQTAQKVFEALPKSESWEWPNDFGMYGKLIYGKELVE